MASINISKVNKSYGQNVILDDIDLDISDGEFIVLVGPSGCGKSTLLRMIAGLDDVTKGDISIGDQVVTHMSPKNRNISMVFQSYALYPHMSVKDNMSYSLKLQKIPKSDIDEKVLRVSQVLGLKDLLERRPKALSGGQRQRVAMGRAIVREPHAFLFDEPLSNLDARLREQMRVEIKRLHQNLGATSIYVTHDQIEAMTLADRIVAMNDGKIQQIGTPVELYQSPANMFVAGFIGSPGMNFLEATYRMQNEKPCALLNDGTYIPLAHTLPLYPGSLFTLGVRPENVFFDETSPLEAKIELIEHTGPGLLVHFKLGEESMKLYSPGDTPIQVGALKRISFTHGKIHFFSRDGERINV